MNLSDLGTKPGNVESILVDVPYVANPLQAYQTLSTNHSILLESAEINSKDDLKSLILIDAALRIECNGNSVVVEALCENGAPLLEVIQLELNEYKSQIEQISTNPTDNFGIIKFSFESVDSDLDEDARLKQHSVFDVLRVIQSSINTLRQHPHAVFLGGVFAYDLLGSFEVLPSVKQSENTCPDYLFYLAETLLLVDHQAKTSQLIGSVFSGENVANHYFEIHQRLEQINKQLLSSIDQSHNFSTDKIRPINSQISVNESKSDNAFCEDVVSLKEHILDGDIFQVVPSRTFSLACPDSLLAYHQLKLTNPSPYMFYMQDPSFVIFGASPESALKYDSDTNDVEVYPIAGTRPRGKRPDGTIDVDLDSRLELDLQQDHKEKSEHIMLVDLARNDVARVSQPGTRHVKDLLKVDRYSHVMHLVSRVIGKLRGDLDALHAYQACMNMGTLVGAPKISAARLIRETEQQGRGSYGGAVGYFNGKGDFDTCIVIRSAFVKDDVAYVQAGAGVVYDSIPQSEADETRVKAQAVISAIKRSHSSTELEGEQHAR